MKPGRPDDVAGAARRRLADGHDDLLVDEAPLLLVVHGQQLLTMRTPGRDEDLALGFLLGEGIVRTIDDVQHVAVRAAAADGSTPDEVQVTLHAAPAGLQKARLARTHEIRSSCGVCGMADPHALLDDTAPLLPGVPKLAPGLFAKLEQQLRATQPLFAATGGCHGAVLTTADGTLVAAAEDVGRHNALDKAIGQAARAGHDLSQLCCMLSGRAGFDLVVKCLRVRIPVIASVSAPSALAFDLCAAAGATLVGFVRDDRHRVYCDGARLATPTP